MMKSFLVLQCATLVAAKDPANGWMAYAVGAIPAKYERITRLEMTWTVGAEPRHSWAFFSPWFGMDPTDNLNLTQPVNPWSGSRWSMYTEYFQWSPVHNSNSRQYSTKAGHTLHGALVYDTARDAYTLTQHNVETGETSSQVVPCQSGKKYTVPYVVYEKVFPCRNYPPDGVVTFRNITAECDGTDCTHDISWAAKVMDANCNMAAHVDDYATKREISITWNTSAPSRFDNYTQSELYTYNSNGWGARVAKAMLEGAPTSA